MGSGAGRRGIGMTVETLVKFAAIILVVSLLLLFAVRGVKVGDIIQGKSERAIDDTQDTPRFDGGSGSGSDDACSTDADCPSGWVCKCPGDSCACVKDSTTSDSCIETGGRCADSCYDFEEKAATKYSKWCQEEKNKALCCKPK